VVYKGSFGSVMAVTLRTIATFEPNVPRLLFSPPFGTYGSPSNFAVAADGQRFLVLIPVEFASPATVVVNWTKLLRP
jgi:hypothetical protein